MRSIIDSEGAVWDVQVGKASYGTLFLLFCRRRDNRCRRFALQDETAFDAEGTLAAMAETELRRALASAGDWSAADGGGP